MKLAPIRSALLALALVAVLLPTAAPPVDASTTTPHITVHTFGWGHGVGMGQWGAEGMARTGHSYHQILEHYYTDSRVETAPSTTGWSNVRVRISSTNDDVIFRAIDPVSLRDPNGSSHVTVQPGELVRVRTSGGQMHGEVITTAGHVRETRTTSATGSIVVRLNGQRAVARSDFWRGSFPQNTSHGRTVGDGQVVYQRGDLAVHGGRSNCAQHCVVLQEMSMNEYLHGLIEVPGGWNTASLRAQAVSARSFAARRVASPRASSYALLDGVLDQAYRGAEGSGGNWPTAVDATGTEVMVYRGPNTTYQGRVIEAYYSSSTGGHTENSEYVWTAMVPWARAVPDPGDDVASPHRRTYTYTKAEIESWFGVSNVTDVRIVGNIGASGRTNRASVRIVGSTTREISADEFRQVINARPGQTRRIDTTNFRVDAGGLGTTGDRLTSASGIALADVGYWVTNPAGAVSARNFAPFHGSMQGQRLNQPVLGMAANPTGTGYWLVASDGGIFSFGNLKFHGSTGNMRLNQPVVGMASTHTGDGYWMVARDGGIFSFGDARFHGSTGNIRLNQPVVGMARTPTGRGYWLVASDGGIFAFGDARFYGSTGSIRLNQPVVAMAPTPSGRGYWLLARDGGVFAFGDARFHGGLAGSGKQAVGIAPTRSGQGYWIVASDGSAYRYGAD